MAYNIPGPITNTNVNSFVPFESAITLSSSTNSNLTSISCPPGKWSISALVEFVGEPTVNGPQQISINTSSTMHGTLGDNSAQSVWLTNSFTSGACAMSIPSYVVNVAVTTTMYLVASAVFSAGNLKAYGRISAMKIN